MCYIAAVMCYIATRPRPWAICTGNLVKFDHVLPQIRPVNYKSYFFMSPQVVFCFLHPARFAMTPLS